MKLSILKSFFKGMTFGAVIVGFTFLIFKSIAATTMAGAGLIIGLLGWFLTDLFIRRTK